jgi:RNA polymerase sigma-70 factor (ECF subfamily)
MDQAGFGARIDYDRLDDVALVALARAGRRQAFRHIMRRCNQRLFRVARGVVHDDAEAEDRGQAAYVDAFEHLGTFRGDASLLTWLTRIVLNEAHGRIARAQACGRDRADRSRTGRRSRDRIPQSQWHTEDPARPRPRRRRSAQCWRRDRCAAANISASCFVMREIEECSVEETATCLGLRPETVKTRLHRARRLLRSSLNDTLVHRRWPTPFRSSAPLRAHHEFGDGAHRSRGRHDLTKMHRHTILAPQTGIATDADLCLDRVRHRRPRRPVPRVASAARETRAVGRFGPALRCSARRAW